MVSRLRALIAFAAVVAAAGSVTAAGLTFTAHTVSQTVAQLPEVKTRVLPSYVVRLPETRAADLDISKTIEVKPKLQAPVTVPAVPVAKPPETPSSAPQAGLTAAVAPVPAEQPTTGGSTYVVRSDVFVRSGPANSYGQVGTVSGGIEVEVTREKAGWLKIRYAGGSGWVYQRYLTPSGNEQLAEAETSRAPF